MATNQENTVVLNITADAGDAVREAGKFDKALRSNEDSVTRLINSLKDQQARLSLTTEQYRQHKLTLMGVTDAQRLEINALNGHIEAAKRAQQVHTGLNQQLRFMRGGFGQIGHQIQDVAVQLQMGTNAMLVFGQQGSQVLSLFGPWGAMAGAVAAVGAAIFTYSQAAEKAKQPTKELKADVKALADEYWELNEAIRSAAGVEIKKEQARLSEEIEKQEVAYKGLNAELAKVTGQLANQGDKKLPAFIEKQKELIDQVVMQAGSIQKLREEFKKYDDTLSGATNETKAWLAILDEMHADEEAAAKKSGGSGGRVKVEAKKITEMQQWLGILGEVQAEEKARDEELKKRAEEEIEVQKWLTQEQDKQARRREEIARREYEVKMQTLTALQGAFGTIAQAGEDATAVQRAAFLAQQAIAVASIIVATNAAAAKAGEAASGAGIGAWLASRTGIMVAGYASAGMVAGQSIASFEGGGITFNGVRAGGMDGKGGRLAMVHPNEKITDLEKSGNGETTPVAVTFQIMANDTRGFDQLLYSRRGQIVNMINQAMNNSGKRGIT